MPITQLPAVADTIVKDTVVTDTTSKAIHEQILDFAKDITSMPTEELFTWALTGTASIILHILLAVVIYIAGRWIIKRIKNFLRKAFSKGHMEITLEKFILSLTSIVLNLFLIFTIVGVLGINTTSFVAIFASAGLAIGMALSGTLQNFAGGVLVLFLKPYRVGDFIDAQGYTGTVKEISLFSTMLNTIDNKLIIIPNGSLANGSINNYSMESIRRVDLTFGVAYGTDFKMVQSVVLDEATKHSLALKDKEVFVGLANLGSSSVDVVLRIWCKSEDYWTLHFDLMEAMYARFNKEGINFPFPQMDVHLHNN